MNNISIERLVLRGFLAAMILLVLLGGIAWHSAVKSDEISSQILRTHQVLTSVGQVMFNLTRAGAARRDYDIYGENYYLKRRDESLLNVIRSVDEAGQHLVVPEQQDRLRQLKMLIAQRMEVFHGDHNSRKSSGQVIAAGFNSSPSVMEQIHHTIDRIVETENIRLREREAENAFQRKVEYVSFVMLSVILLSSLFLLLHILRALRQVRDEEMPLKNAKLEEESRVKSELMAHMSHELRTPINAIMGFSDLLKAGQLGKLSRAQAEYISDIYSSGQHMLALVNNILDMSKAEAGKMTLDLEPVEISELLANSISIIKEQVASQRVFLNFEVQPGLGGIYIQADTLKVRQIILNLLSNAVKFTLEGGRLRFGVRRVPRSEVGQVSGYWPSRTFPLARSEFMEFLEISVADDGIGIPPEGLERLFQPYSQINSGSARKFEGTGLGLMLVKCMAELHGGTVAVESAESQGSLFIVWLPLRTDVGAMTVSNELMQQQFTQRAISKACKVKTKEVLEQARKLAQQRTFVHV